MNKVITIKDGKVVPNENVLAIPELRAVYDHYEGETRDLAFQYLHFLYDLESPYRNIVDEEEREQMVRKDFRGDYNPRLDDPMITASEKMLELNYSLVGDSLDSLRINIKNINTALRTEEVNTGRDGNINQFVALHSKMNVMLKNYKAVEREFVAEVEKNRGDYKQAIDSEDDDF